MGKIVHLESLEEYTARMDTGPKFDRAYLVPLGGIVVALLLILTVKGYESTKKQVGSVSTQTEITSKITK